MKATGIVRRIDDLGRVVIPKEIRRTMRIREGDPSLMILTQLDRFLISIHSVVNRYMDPGISAY
ncbi:MAG: AbrB/MazE/SpoVT family DNA-binding domain-containing protein [Clostridia bacterium]|nr:AbrB/MazE/SpoVT family DNA-binding domain-containing protein [Clostridia bacterium]